MVAKGAGLTHLAALRGPEEKAPHSQSRWKVTNVKENLES